MSGESRLLPLIIYEPLASGTAVVASQMAVKAESLRTVQTALGGYWELAFQIQGRQTQIEGWIDGGLARHVELYNPALVMIWEGFVNQVDANIGSLSLTRGPLLSMANKISCVYSTKDMSVTPPAAGVREFSDWYDNADSQAKYGILEKVLSAGGAATGEPAQIAQTALAELKEPTSQETDNLESSARPSASITCLGYAHWMKKYTYTSTTEGTESATTKLENVITGDPNSFLSTDFTNIETNATVVGAFEAERRTAWNLAKGLAAVGDSSYDRWLFGLYAGRKVKYSVMPTTTKYQRSLIAPAQQLELYSTGGRVYPWDARPGEWAFYTDLLIGRTQPSDRRLDPRYLFIEQATFTVPWGLTLTGAKVARLDQLLAQMGLAGAA